MAKRIPTVKVKFRDGFKTINESDFDESKHELFDKPSKKKKEATKEVQHEFGDYKAQTTRAAGWWEVINTETGEVQNDKSLREADAIALAQELSEE